MQITLLRFAISICISISIGYCLLLNVQSQAFAAITENTKSISQEIIPTLTESLTLKSEVDSFLNSIPSGYYTIATVKELKREIDTTQPLLVDVRERSEYQGEKIAISKIRELQEGAGQVVYQVRQPLKDQHGNNWQAIAFKRIREDGKTSFFLRLVGFPKAAAIDRSQPLTLTNSLGKILTANDASSGIFTDSTDSFAPTPNVGQYDLQPILSQLQIEIPLKLSLPIMGDEAISLPVPSSFVEEWHAVDKLQP